MFLYNHSKLLNKKVYIFQKFIIVFLLGFDYIVIHIYIY